MVVLSRRRVARAVLGGMAVAHVLGALLMRYRREQMTALPRSPGSAPSTGGPGQPGRARALSVRGCHVSEATLAAAAAEMEASGADVIELVPGDLPADRALSLLFRTDLDRLRDDPMYFGPSATDAVAVRAEVAHRMGVPEDGESLERGALVRRAVAAHRHSRSSLVRVAPDLAAPPMTPRDRWRELEGATAFSRPYASLAPVVFGVRTAWLVTLTAGALVAPVAGLAALAAWSSQPLLVFAGGAPEERQLAPRRLVRASLLRLPQTWLDHLRMVVPAYRATREAYARLATTPATPLPPVEERFDERHESCPWCGSPELVGMFDLPDFYQQKPGTTHLDRCAGCGLVLQNPPLSVKGLDYYYEHFYDGIGGETADFGLATMTSSHQGRLDAVARFTEPRAWLDVGAGYGHFSAVARRRWPEAIFDGLDFGETVEEGQRRGWLDTAYRGLFPELADSLPRSYDVLSMHHYLEHTRDPRLELVTAARVLEPGGHLMIEVPDPESPWSLRLGRWGYSWGQPQHQQFVPCDELVKELEDLGFEVLSVERGPACLGHDLLIGVVLGIQTHSRNPFVPWLPPPSVADRVKRAGVTLAALPALVAAGLADLVKDARTRRPGHVGNTYRVVARRS